MKINEALEILNNSGKAIVTKGTTNSGKAIVTKGTPFSEDTYFWQGLSKHYKPGDPLTPRNSTIGMVFSENEIIDMAEKMNNETAC